MSALSHIRSVLDHAHFPSPRIRSLVTEVVDALDGDLERSGFEPSSATENSLRALLDAIREVERVAEASGDWSADEERAEEERDKERLS